MSWSNLRYTVKEAQLKALEAERTGMWHLVVQQYIYCLKYAHKVGNKEAIKFFAAKLSRAYTAMDMHEKASYYSTLAKEH